MLDHKTDYAITSDKDTTMVTVYYPNKTTSIKFDGNRHKQDAMEFVAQFLMVQMGQIGI